MDHKVIQSLHAKDEAVLSMLLEAFAPRCWPTLQLQFAATALIAGWRSEYCGGVSATSSRRLDRDRRRDGQLSVTLLTSMELLYSKDGRYFGGFRFRVGGLILR